MHSLYHLLLLILLRPSQPLPRALYRRHLQRVLGHKLLVLHRLLHQRVLHLLLLAPLPFLNILTPFGVRVLDLVQLHTGGHLSDVHLASLFGLELADVGSDAGVAEFDLDEVGGDLLFFLELLLVLEVSGFFEDCGDVLFLLGEFLSHLEKFLVVCRHLGFMFLLHFFDLGD